MTTLLRGFAQLHCPWPPHYVRHWISMLRCLRAYHISLCLRSLVLDASTVNNYPLIDWWWVWYFCTQTRSTFQCCNYPIVLTITFSFFSWNYCSIGQMVILLARGHRFLSKLTSEREITTRSVSFPSCDLQLKLIKEEIKSDLKRVRSGGLRTHETLNWKITELLFTC